MILPQEAWDRLQEVARPLPPVPQKLSSSLGLILAEPVVARRPVPPSSVAAMDGYAVRLAAAGKALPLAFTVKAGENPPPLPEGTCARIFTGAVVPPGAEAVIPQEEVALQGELVAFSAVTPGVNIRQAGEVCRPGDVLLTPGTVLGPRQLACFLAAGVRGVVAFPRPRVAVVVTGSELTDHRPTPGQIVDTNSPMLSALLKLTPSQVTKCTRVGDHWEQLRQTLLEALEMADLVITSGGVSVGDFDFLPRLVTELGGHVLFHQVAMQPGKPVLAATFGPKGVLGLPGNPVSALVGFHLFARPWLLALAGDPKAFPLPWQTFPLAQPVANLSKRHQFLPAVVASHREGARVSPVPWKGSHDLRAAAIATHLVHLPSGFRGAAGTEVATLPLL